METLIFKSDIIEITTDRNIPWFKLCDSTILVTGATGLVGGVLIRVLAAADVEHNLNIRIIGHGRNKDLGAILSQELGIEFIYGDIRDLISISAVSGNLDYIFHCASITKSSEMVSNPVDVITTAVDGTRNILELVRKRDCKGFIYLSSMEVYGKIDGIVHEGDLGYLDLSNPRSCYPESKRFCEMMCISYAKQYNIPVKIARLAQTFGAGTPKDDTRVFAQFARSAIAGDDIELHTEGKSRGNYCYSADTLRALLTILLKGSNGEVYNIANPNTSVTIREMAELVANDLYDGKVKVVIKVPDDIKQRGYAEDSGFILNVDKLNALGWKPQYGLDEMYKRMIADWQDVN